MEGVLLLFFTAARYVDHLTDVVLHLAVLLVADEPGLTEGTESEKIICECLEIKIDFDYCNIKKKISGKNPKKYLILKYLKNLLPDLPQRDVAALLDYRGDAVYHLGLL